MWTLEFSRDALKSLLRMQRADAKRVRAKLENLVRDPMRMPNVKKLSGHPGYRLRIGDWRVIYLLDERRVVVVVIRIAQRSEAFE